MRVRFVRVLCDVSMPNQRVLRTLLGHRRLGPVRPNLVGVRDVVGVVKLCLVVVASQRRRCLMRVKCRRILRLVIVLVWRQRQRCKNLLVMLLLLMTDWLLMLLLVELGHELVLMTVDDDTGS